MSIKQGDGNRGVTMDEVAQRGWRVAGDRVAGRSTATRGSTRRRSARSSRRSSGSASSRTSRPGRLVTRRSDSIGVVIPEPTSRVFGDPFFAQVLRGVSSALTARRQKLVLFLPQGDEEERELAAVPDGRPRRRRDHVFAPRRRPAARSGSAGGAFPVVVGGLPPTGARVSYVDNDNRGGADGRPRSTCSSSGGGESPRSADPPDMARGHRPLEGYRDALRAAGVPFADDARRRRRLHPGERRRARCASCSPSARSRRRLRGQRPDGRRRARRSSRRPVGASPTTSPSSASTTRRSPSRRGRPCPACGSPSTRWAGSS